METKNLQNDATFGVRSVTPGLYQHYKEGDHYLVFGVTRDSTNGPTEGRIDVDYLSINPRPDCPAKGRHHRELQQFFSTVSVGDCNDPVSHYVPRFKLVVAMGTLKDSVEVSRESLAKLTRDYVTTSQALELRNKQFAHVDKELSNAAERIRALKEELRAAEKWRRRETERANSAENRLTVIGASLDTMRHCVENAQHHVNTPKSG